jgi:nitric oxide reductase subunit B
VTVSHGHLSFYGAYVLLNLTFFYLAIPRIKGFPDGEYSQRTGHFAFWLTSLGVVGMGLAFGVAGVLQTYLERIQGQPYMVAQEPIRFWMAIVAAHGLMVVAGALLIVKHLLTLKPDTFKPATAIGKVVAA